MSNEIKVRVESTSPIADPVQLKTVKYDNLTSKPKINGVELVGDKSTADLKIEVDTSKFATKEELAGKADISDIPDAYDDTEIRTLIDEVEETSINAKAIAEGKATGYVFDTVEDMNAWIETNSSMLKLGDNLYIRAVDVPDYWWDGETVQQLETQKVDLADYVKNTDYAGIDGKAGVFIPSTVYGVRMQSGYLQSFPITSDKYETVSKYSFIGKGTLENIKDDYVKRGITANAITLTDEEKAAAQAWLGVDGDYLPLSGGTLTGPLGIRKATFRQEYNDLYLDLENVKGVFTFNCGGGRFNPYSDGFGGLGQSGARWGVVCTKNLNNGADIAIPTTGGTMLVNGATGENSFAIGGTASGVYSVVIGYGATAVRDSVAQGANANANSGGVAIGYGASTAKSTAAAPQIAIGRNAKVDCIGTAIQLGDGTNSDPNTFKIANANGNFEMMSADGTIPAERMTAIIALTETSVELATNKVYNAAEMTELTITLPTADAAFISQLNFTSGATATAFTAPDTIKWAGDDITNGAFVPATNKRYAIMFYSDGVSVRAIAQGVE